MCACSSPRLPLTVYSLRALTHACSTTSARAELHYGLGSASQRLRYAFIYTAHTTHTPPPATLAPRFSSIASAPTPCSTEMRSSFLCAAITSTNSLIGDITSPFFSEDHFQLSASTYVVTSLYDHSDCCDACSDRGLPASLSARRRLPARHPSSSCAGHAHAKHGTALRVLRHARGGRLGRL